jgi:hypothetical protein
MGHLSIRSDNPIAEENQEKKCTSAQKMDEMKRKAFGERVFLFSGDFYQL